MLIYGLMIGADLLRETSRVFGLAPLGGRLAGLSSKSHTFYLFDTCHSLIVSFFMVGADLS